MDTPRRQPTPAEAELERILNTLGGGALAGEFWREFPVGNWLIDFYFPAIKLAIEVDGGYHRAPLQWRRDLHKTAELEARGITVLRLTNAEVLGERARLIEKLRVAWRVARAQTSARTNMRGNSTGDRFEVREPAAPGYAVTPIIDMGSIELIFAEEIARTKQWAANTARRAVNTALLASMTGVEMVHVPFKGESPRRWWNCWPGASSCSSATSRRCSSSRAFSASLPRRARRSAAERLRR